MKLQDAASSKHRNVVPRTHLRSLRGLAFLLLMGAAWVCAALPAQAQAGHLDPTFAMNGIFSDSFNGGTNVPKRSLFNLMARLLWWARSAASAASCA